MSPPAVTTVTHAELRSSSVGGAVESAGARHPHYPSLAGILGALVADPGFAELQHVARATVLPASLDVVTAAEAYPVVVAGITAAQRPMLILTATSRGASEIATSLRCLAPEVPVFELPAWETLPHERLSPRADTIGRRMAVFHTLFHADIAGADNAMHPPVVVSSIRAVMQPISPQVKAMEPVVLQPGSTHDMNQVVTDLTHTGYTRVDLVGRRGEFAVRGGILDVFAPTDDHPQRVQWWGDEVEEVRWFSVADQRSLEVSERGVWAPPCREFVLDAAMQARAAIVAEQLPGVADLARSVAAGIAMEGMESLLPVLQPDLTTLLDLVPASTMVVATDPPLLERRSADVQATSTEFLTAAWHNATVGNEVPIDVSVLDAGSYRDVATLRQVAQRRGLPWWSLTPLQTALGDAGPEIPQDSAARTEPERHIVVAMDPVGPYRGAVGDLLADLRAWAGDAWLVAVCAAGQGSAQRMAEVLADEGIPARLTGNFDPQMRSVVQVMAAPVDPGWRNTVAKVALMSPSDVAGKRVTASTSRRLPSRRRAAIDPLQLRPGDFVVHEHHGVGRFVELVQRNVGGAEREYLVIEYSPSKKGQPGDRLFVPSDGLDQITKYVGGEAPTLSKMGGGDWAKTKSRARKAVRQIAAELIRLYSARMASVGHAFGPDTTWQRELEDAFDYVETPDQLACIDEVKNDMEQPVPMDRLVCGDVGYGKTEIAVRAAFKAVQEGKQVAVLVPTTLLVHQHVETFADRYASFPVRVKGLSRFATANEAAEVRAAMADGSVDVVIGTHALLAASVQFKDLGLIIVDEEQRFGVEHKEKLKAMRTNVDVLSMSATPIPRTLEMAVTGIREMSTLATPPEERHPVLTFVGPYDERQIKAAIHRELLRDGQVFYLHNRVESIDRAAARLRELVPEARVAVAHGGMGDHQLEQVIMSFWNREVDVLVCTTIVENGLDIANANTIIIERADQLGLSQLHQLRGRVGRSRERAYAYFVYPPEKPLTQTAYDRLATIAQFTDIGAGMQVAMKDLEIRGAGNLLGAEQSGHIEGVGFDLYVRMVGEAVAEFKGETPVDQHAELKIELPITAFLPHDYVPTERLRLEAYRRLADVHVSQDVAAVRGELTDRYGQPPEPVVALLSVAELRVRARELGLTEIVAQGKNIRFAPVRLPDSVQLRMRRLYPGTMLKSIPPATLAAEGAASAAAVLVPAPVSAAVGGRPLRDAPLLAWVGAVLEDLTGGPVG